MNSLCMKLFQSKYFYGYSIIYPQKDQYVSPTLYVLPTLCYSNKILIQFIFKGVQYIYNTFIFLNTIHCIDLILFINKYHMND